MLDDTDWLYFDTKSKPTKDKDLAISIADNEACDWAEKLRQDDATWQLREKVDEIISSGKAGVVALPDGAPSFTIEKRKDGYIRVEISDTATARNKVLLVKYSPKRSKRDPEFSICVVKIVKHIKEKSF